MPMVVETKDCTALGDAELEELADLGVNASGFDIGFLSKEREAWVLVTTVRDGRKLRGYSFCTLERIGGTPSLLVGVASVDRTTRADGALKTIMADQFRRALLAFPDEDVLLGTRLLSPEGFRAFAGLSDVVPSPGQRASGEERAWGRRLAKRFGAEGKLDDRTFRRTGCTSSSRVSTRLAATAWSPSAGRWPRISPPASSRADPPGRRPSTAREDRGTDLVAVAVARAAHRREHVVRREAERGGERFSREPLAS